MIDEIEYELPAGDIGFSFTESSLERLFHYRHLTLKNDIEHHKKAKLSHKRILIGGASGLVGTALKNFFETGGHEVATLKRHAPLVEKTVENFDYVFNLSGENLAARRWTESVKKEIRQSRIVTTANLVAALTHCENKPEAFISASAVGIYGNRGSEILKENASLGLGFLADLCKDWEATADLATEAGIHVLHPRFGMILSPKGGALEKMLTPFKLGLGAALGDGKQYVSTIGIDDMLYGILHLLANKVYGPVNLVSPEATTNLEFSKTLASVLNRPLAPSLPAFSLRILFGEIADEALLSSCRAFPHNLFESGFRFTHSNLEKELRHLLGK